MKIAVVGAGAMGSILGARFARGGHDTVLVDVVAPLVETINAEGVTVVRGEEETTTRVPATTDPASVGAVDLVVFFTKCYHTAAAAESARPLVGPDTVVASLQNGWGNGDVLAGVYPEEQIVVGVTYNSGLVQAPGRVVHPADQPTIVGSFADGQADDARPARLAEALADGGLEVSVAAPVRPEIWKKLILNAATLPTAALTGDARGRAHRTRPDARPRQRHGARGGIRRARPGLRHRRAGARRLDPRAAREGGALQGVDAAGLRGGAEDGDRRDQRRRRPRGRRAGDGRAVEPGVRPARQGLGVLRGVE